MLDPEQVVVRDANSAVHEACHAVVAVALGLDVVRVIAHRHYAEEAHEGGSVEWLGGTPFDEATVRLAPTIYQGFGLPGTGDDERRARKACPLGINAARARAFIILSRNDQAVRELAHALDCAPDKTLNGHQVREVLDGLLR